MTDEYPERTTATLKGFGPILAEIAHMRPDLSNGSEIAAHAIRRLWEDLKREEYLRVQPTQKEPITRTARAAQTVNKTISLKNKSADPTLRVKLSPAIENSSDPLLQFAIALLKEKGLVKSEQNVECALP